MSAQLAFVLRSQRIAAGLSQNALAKRAGVVAAYVLRIERGIHCPSRAVVDGLARALSLDDSETDRLIAAAGYIPWSLSPEDTRLLLEIGGRIAQAAVTRREETG